MKQIIISAALVTLSSFANANIVQNGSFEQNSQANNTWDVYTGNSVNGWNILSGSGIEIRNDVEGTASNGVNYVELDSFNNTVITQSVTTSSGALYELLFDYSPRVNQPATTNGISVFWNGTLLADITGTGGVSNLWVTQHFFVTGTGNDVLQFAATGTDDGYGGNIDYVQLNEVPLPAAAWLFGSALVMFGFARRSTV